jgi:hypothetical protein
MIDNQELPESNSNNGGVQTQKISPLSRYTVIGKWLFNWVSPYIKIGFAHKITYDMMPPLKKEFQSHIYTSKMRYFFNLAFKKFQKEDGKDGRIFILKIIWSCFKWKLIFAMFLAFVQKLLEYSTSFFIQQILQIKDNYNSEDYFWIFIGLSTLMVLVKIFNSILTENATYFILL